MFIPLIVGSVAVFLTYLTRYRQNGLGLKLAFAVIFVFLALRYDYGNDYMNYLDGYNNIVTNTQIFLTGETWEPGWRLLNAVFRPFGFFALVGCTSLATCIVYHWFIRSYVPARYQWLAVFLYTFDPYQILVTASAMRQNIGILLFLIGIRCLYKKRIVIYLTLVIAGAFFHKSAIVLLPIVLLAYVNVKINKFVACVLALVYVSLFWFNEAIFSFVNPLLAIYFPTFASEYLYGLHAEFNSGLGFVYAMFQLVAILYFAGMEFDGRTESFEGDQDMEFDQSLEEPELLPVGPIAAFDDIAARRLLFKLAIMTFIFTPLARQVLMVGRINMYFAPVMLTIFPIILYTTRNRFFHLVLLWSLIPFTMYKFWAFFVSPVWRAKFGTYQTIFSSPRWY